ncbi:MAG: hypothetical protein IJU16_00090, partial [Clostridia bacterium]|nr:hypothetical protein [Clostridia bacterium]
YADNYSDSQLSGVVNTVISNSDASNYVNAAMRYYLRTNDRVKRNLDNNTAVVFFFDGCSDNVFSSSFNYKSNHMSAYVAVVKLRNGVPTIIYENENASTIPDNPRMVNNTTAGNDGTDVPTVTDGIHNISTTNHLSKYAALHVHDSDSGVSVVRCNSSTYYASTSYGINAHARSWDYVSTSTYSSTGCFNIGKSSPATEYNNFMYAVTGISNAKSNTFSSTGADKGIVIVDRYMYKSTLTNIYGSAALVNQITAYSTNLAPTIQQELYTPPTFEEIADVDGDGKVSTTDVRVTLRRVVGNSDIPQGSADFLPGDVDLDGSLTTTDVRQILRSCVTTG